MLLHAMQPDQRRNNLKKNIERIGGRISPDYVAKMILFAYEMPQNVIMQEVVVTPTKQDY